MTSAPKTDEPVDEYAATVVLDEHTVTVVLDESAAGRDASADTPRENLAGGDAQDIEAALGSPPRR